MGLLILFIVAIFLIGALPVWPYSRGWGYRPVWIIGALFLVLLIVISISSISHVEVDFEKKRTFFEKIGDWFKKTFS